MKAYKLENFSPLVRSFSSEAKQHGDSAILYTVVPSHTISVYSYRIRLLKSDSFGIFTSAFVAQYPVLLSGASFVNALYSLFLLYLLLVYSASSAFVDFLSRHGSYFEVPLFISVVHQRFGMKVVCTSRSDGQTTGTSVCATSPESVLRTLYNIDKEVLKTIVSGASPFSSISDAQVVALREKLNSFVLACGVQVQSALPHNSTPGATTVEVLNFDNFSNDKFYENLLEKSLSIRSCLKDPNSVKYVTTDYPRTFSSLINVHRFRSHHTSTSFCVGATSVSKLSTQTLNEFCVLFRILSGKFLQGEPQKELCKDLLPSEVIFETSNFGLQKCYMYLLGLTTYKYDSPNSSKELGKSSGDLPSGKSSMGKNPSPKRGKGKGSKGSLTGSSTKSTLNSPVGDQSTKDNSPVARVGNDTTTREFNTSVFGLKSSSYIETMRGLVYYHDSTHLYQALFVVK